MGRVEPSSPMRKWSKWVDERRCGRARWCADRVKLNVPLCDPLYKPIARTLVAAGLTGHMGRWRGHFGLGRAPLWASLISVVVPVSCYCFYILYLLVYGLNLNLISIPANPYNPVEYFCNIVMMNFMFRL
jgi:hypothetical protein